MSRVKQPTPRQLEVLAAWWWGRGSNRKAAFMLGIREQTVKTTLWHLRTAQQADTNVELVLRFMDEIDAHKADWATSHNVSAGKPEALVPVPAW